MRRDDAYGYYSDDDNDHDDGDENDDDDHNDNSNDDDNDDNDNGYDNDDVGNDADLNRRPVLVRICPTPSIVYDVPL